MKTARRLLTLSAILVLVITTISAYLRLSQYGMGCADWPACYGINAVGELLLSESSPLFWARAIHRVTATVAGLLFVAIAVFWWNGWRSNSDRMLSFAPLAIAAFLAWLGRYTPSSLPAVTMGNLLGGMAALAVLWWLRTATVAHPARLAPRAAAIGLGLMFVQLAIGGLTSARFAAAACPAFPECGAVAEAFDIAGLNPFADIAQEDIGEGTRQTLHMLHRIFGLAVAIYLVWLGARLRKPGLPLLCLVALQVIASVALVFFKLPLMLAVAHNLIAALLILALVSLAAGSTDAAVAGNSATKVPG